MKRMWIAVFVLALAVPVMVVADTTDTKITIKPIVGASFGSVQRGDNEGVSRVSYWAGTYLKSITPDIAVWAAYQQTKLEDLDLTGSGGKLLLTVKNKDYRDWTLLIGGGWLADFAIDGDGTRTTAFTFDMGVMYEWLWDQVYIGALGSAVDYGPRLDWSADLGVVVMF